MSDARPSRRLPWLLAVFGIAAILVLTDERKPAGVVEATRGGAAAATPAVSATPVASQGPASSRAAATGARAAVDAEPAILELRARARGADAQDLFARHSWTPPPAPAAPVRPVPPAFGYTVLGKQFIDGRWEVFLSQGPRTLIVKQGDVIDGAFTVERIAPPAMTLAVARFDERQTVAIGAAD